MKRTVVLETTVVSRIFAWASVAVWVLAMGMNSIPLSVAAFMLLVVGIANGRIELHDE